VGEVFCPDCVECIGWDGRGLSAACRAGDEARAKRDAEPEDQP
jgi:hypothetical protein